MSENEVTSEELAVLRSCGPDERCLIYGNDWIKVPTERLVQIMEHAFREAYADAAQALGEPVEAFEIAEMSAGDTAMVVTVTGASGRTEFGIGAIPDPRVH